MAAAIAKISAVTHQQVPAEETHCEQLHKLTLRLKQRYCEKLNLKSSKVIGSLISSYLGTNPAECDPHALGAVNDPLLHSLRAQCLGKRSCTITASTALHGDPCPGQEKQLTIKYRCGRNTAKQARASEGTTIELVCP